MSADRKILGLIMARAGSKGVPDKNMRMLAGRPLLLWTLLAARAANGLDRIIISTDSSEMAELARQNDIEVPFMRPPELAADAARGQDVILHALDFMQTDENYAPDALMLLQPTSPLREPKDIEACVSLFLERRPDGVVSVTDAGKHPYFHKRFERDGKLKPFFPDADMTANRQEWPRAYVLNGAIFLRRSCIYRNWDMNARRGVNPEGKCVLGYAMPRERSVEIDDELDFVTAELLLKR